jgi:mediator of RNA polymerase II transcription subunit 17
VGSSRFPAYADFRDRGLAALRRDQDGDVSLDRGPRSSDRVLRVQIVQKGNVLSSSCDPAFAPPKNEDGNVDDLENMPIEQQILQARNAIFDEELHSELHREARNLVNQGVRCIGDFIQVPYEADKHLEIDLLDHEKGLLGASQNENTIANAIAIALRILLSHAHRQNLHQRSQPPPPITDSKRPRPIYSILKPIIENIRHRSDVRSLRDRLSNLTTTLKQAGLPLDIDHTATTLNIPPSLSLTRKDEALVTDSLLNALTSPLRTSINMKLPSRQTSLNIDVHTNLFPPTLGTEFRTTMTTSVSNFYMSNLPETMPFSTLTDLEEHITHLLTLDLVTLVNASDQAWEVVNPYIGSISQTTEGKDGKLGTMSLRLSFEADRALLLEWQSRKEDEEEVRRGTARWEGDKGEKVLMDVVRELGESVVS